MIVENVMSISYTFSCQGMDKDKKIVLSPIGKQKDLLASSWIIIEIAAANYSQIIHNQKL